MFYCCVSFFFKETATHEIYTCCTTLSLHDVLPIYARLRRHGCQSGTPDLRRVEDAVCARLRQLRLRSLEPGPRDDEQVGPKRPSRQRHVQRSEEHTSELQSLMRNASAVFCLKKKQNSP